MIRTEETDSGRSDNADRVRAGLITASRKMKSFFRNVLKAVLMICLTLIVIGGVGIATEGIVVLNKYNKDQRNYQDDRQDNWQTISSK